MIEECEREGSLDSAIRHEKVNDIAYLIQAHPTIRMVICNGKKSYDLYQKHFHAIQIPCMYLPSTSNANRTIKEQALFEAWKQAFKKADIL